MNRRIFLGTIGSIGSLGVIGYASREVGPALEIRFWRSGRAGRYPNVPSRVTEYVEYALDLPFWSVSVTDGGIVPVGTENGARVTTSGEWPATVIAGQLRRTGIEPASDVNLLVTDGEMSTAPTGFGAPHIASVGGARYVNELPPIEDQPDPATITTGTFAMQVLLHEVGHALGLRHDHGEVVRRGSTYVVSPMISAYAWDSSFRHDRSACGSRYPELSRDRRRARKLSFAFSACAQRRLRAYNGRLTP